MESTNLYVLALSDGKYYVGASREPQERVLQHFAGQGAEWTRRHPPVKVVECVKGDVFDEDKLTKRYMQRYGIDSVRGGSYCALTLSESDRLALQKELKTVERRCFRCGSREHFAYMCRAAPMVPVTPLPETPLRPKAQRCERCRRFGHTASHCFARTDRDGWSLDDDSWEPSDGEDGDWGDSEEDTCSESY